MFASYTRDGGSGLDYAVNRWYSSGTGRFMSADPSTGVDAGDPGSWNRYAYVGGDPVGYTDRLGLQRDICEDPDDSVYIPVCIERARAGRWTIGIGSSWNGEYWNYYPVPIWVPGPQNLGGGGGRPTGQSATGAILPMRRNSTGSTRTSRMP